MTSWAATSWSMKLVLLVKVAAEAAGQEVVADAEVTAVVVAVAEAEAAVVAVAAEEAAAGVTAEIVGIAGVEAETGAGKFFSWKPGFDGRRGAAAAPRFSFGVTLPPAAHVALITKNPPLKRRAATAISCPTVVAQVFRLAV